LAKYKRPLPAQPYQVYWIRMDPMTQDRNDNTISPNGYLSTDPLGGLVPGSDPYTTFTNPDYGDLLGARPGYDLDSDPFDPAGGCTLDGVPINCNIVMSMANHGGAVVAPFKRIDTISHQAWLANSLLGLSLHAFYDQTLIGLNSQINGQTLLQNQFAENGLLTDVGFMQNPFPSFSPDDLKVIEDHLRYALELTKRKECDQALLKDYKIPSLAALVKGLKASGSDANIFDGRTSSLSLPIGKDNSVQTVATYFKENKQSVGAAVFHKIPGIADGDATFLGYGFFNPGHTQWPDQQQAIILIHEAVHQIGKKGDGIFGGSRELSEKIIKGCYPILKGKLGGVG
jgi:hypothetical protein